MPAVITCDSCSAKLRTPVAPLGKTVKCPKCGTAFVVTATNAQEVGAPKPAPSFEVVDDEPPAPKPAPAPAPKAKSKPVVEVEAEVADEVEAAEVAEEDDTPPKRKKKGRDDDERPTRNRKKRDEEDDDDDRPTRKKRRDEDYEDDDDRTSRKKKGGKQGGSKLPLIIGGSVLALLLLGVGGYFAFSGGDKGGDGKGGDTKGGNSSKGNESTLNTRPKRDVSKDLFVYWPTQRHTLTYTDFAGPRTTPATLPSDAAAFGVTPDMVLCGLSSTELSSDNVVAYTLKAPFDLAKGAEKAKWREIKVGDKTAYRHPLLGQAVFQPKPTVLVVVARFGNAEPNSKLIEELWARTPESAPFPDAFWSVLQEVSGYESFSGRVPKPGDEFVSATAKYRIDGYANTETHRENLTIFEYTNEAEAKRAETSYKQIDSSLGGKTTREVSYEVVGARLYRFTKTPLAKKK
ncbi:MAG: hypothetical protein FJ304_00700 [Planctomycetes bacterium]|nr:hypothetical protein [Planctomycetota bacterium]